VNASLSPDFDHTPDATALTVHPREQQACRPRARGAIKSGKLSKARLEDGSYSFDPSELTRWIDSNGHRKSHTMRIATPVTITKTWNRTSHWSLAEKELHLDELSPEAAILRLVEFTWIYCLKHPELLTLVNNENLHRAKRLKHPSQSGILAISLSTW
jgi:hypothetical protein